MILKWFLITVALALGFKYGCEKIAQMFLSSSSIFSRVNVKPNYSDMKYDQSLIAWAETGRRLQNEQASMKPIEQRNDLQLIGAQIFFRHGARTPLHLLPSLEEVLNKRTKILNFVFCLRR